MNIINTWSKIDAAYNKALNTPLAKMPVRLVGLPYIDEPYHKFLYFLAKEVEAVLCLELGVYQGTGLACLAEGSATVIGVDNIVQDWDENLKPFLNCRVQIDDSVVFLEYYMGHSFDIVHIDTIHNPEHVSRELEAALPILAKGGVICIDDINYSDDMWTWWQSLKLPKKTFGDLHVTGFGVIVPDA